MSVIIPTYRRPDSLSRCLEGLRRQSRQPHEVLVIIREGDEESRQLIEQWRHWPAVKVLTQSGTGAVGQYNRGLDRSEGDVVAFTDDDAIPRPDWLERIEAWFAENPDLGGIGGRDIVHVNGEPVPGRPLTVGVVQWFGRIVHNHHLSTRRQLSIDILKGVNMSFRRKAIGNVRFEKDLRGSGAQVCLDMAFSFDVRKQNWRLVFDPEVIVDHFPARRFDSDQRSAPSLEAVENAAYNFYLTLRRHMKRGLRREAALCWAYWVGVQREPGLIRGLVSRIRSDEQGLAMRIAARRAWSSAKQDCHE